MNGTGEAVNINKFRHKIALIIPSRNRPRILARLLDSIKTQTVQPDQANIVDGSDQPIEAEIEAYIDSSVTYERVFPPGLTMQRNEGRKALRDEIALVGYLDDDIVMEKEATEDMLNFWETAPKTSLALHLISRIHILQRLTLRGKHFSFTGFLA